MHPSQFVSEHEKDWKTLEDFDKRIRRSGWNGFHKKEIWALALLYRKVSSHLALAKTHLPKSRITDYLNRLVSRIYNRFYGTRVVSHDRFRNFFLYEYPQVMRRNLRQLALASGIFVSSAWIGWTLTGLHPSNAEVLLSPKMIEAVREGKVWTEGILNLLPSSVLSVQIFCNNISVSFFTFAFGLLLGVGTCYMLFLNGLMLGSIFAFTGFYGVDHKLLDFVIAHGPLELTLICVAGGAGFRLAKAQLFPGARTRNLALREEGAEAIRIVLGSVPFFILAGLVEGYISPQEGIPFLTKALVGILLLISYFLYIFRGKKIEGPAPKPNAGRLMADLQSLS